MEFKEATLEERHLYYKKEWKIKDLPPFLIDSLKQREFGFDHDGNGPKDRYETFNSVREFERFMKIKAPYAAYSSISYYEKPEKREGWMKAEIVFDIDAKDLKVRRCDCTPGNICEICLEDAKELALTIIDTLRSNFDLKNIFLIYSGRGYHVRVLDEEALYIEDRSKIFDYVTASRVPEDLFMKHGYPEVFRKMFAFTFSRMKNMRSKELIENREEIINRMLNRRVDFLDFVRKNTKKRILESVAEINRELVDGKVTIDTKRILRLPSSLHSKVSMICRVVKDWENFDPLRDAVPKFRK
ncbi:MAG: DNA primase catalytic subunit PriS [Methanomicrobia archaeon]|nr:DNA primase catalytic subunit PriS [Methanomicrobia archaeon]